MLQMHQDLLYLTLLTGDSKVKALLIVNLKRRLMTASGH